MATIALYKELDKIISLYNEYRQKEQHLDYWEVVDELVDPTDEQEVSNIIIEILRNI